MTETATFAIALDDQASGAAKAAAGALQDLKKKIEGDIGALAEMNAAMRRLKGGTSMNVEAYKHLKASIAAKHASIAKMQEQYVLLGGTFGKVANGATQASSRFAGMTEAISAGNPALGGMLGRVGGLGKMLGAAGLAGIAVAAAAAIIGLGVALAGVGLHMADVIRTQQIQMQGLAALGKAYQSLGQAAILGGGMFALIAGKASATVGEGDALTAMVGRVTEKFAVGREQVLGYMKSLMQARLSGKNLEAALDGAATMSSVFGEEAAGSFINMAKQAQFFGSSVKSLANNVQAKFGDMARSLKLGLGAQIDQLKTNLGKLFTGIKIEGFLNGLHEVLSVFSQSTASGRALKALTETILQPLYSGAASLGPILKNLWRGVIIGALMGTIAFLKIRNAFRDAFGKDTISNIDWMNVALYTGATIGLALAAAVGLMVGAWSLLIAAHKRVAQGLAWMIDQFTWAYSFLKEWSGSGAELGTLFVNGLVLGIQSAASGAWNAVKNLAQGLKNAFTSVMQIQSPSKVFFGYGVNIGQGAMLGMQHVQPQVEQATANMVSMPSLPIPSASSYTATTNNNSQRGPTTINISIDGAGGDAKALAKQVIEIFQDYVEGEVITIGGELLAT